MTGLNKRIFITGATHGIGRAAVELFCSRGWDVYGISSNASDGRGAEMMRAMPCFRYRTIDVCNEDGVAAFLNEIAPLDAAFNNAGIGIAPRRITDADITQAMRVINTNLVGTMICMKYELRNMHQGVIINNSSLSAIKAGTGADMSYSASKAGILRLTAEAAILPEYQGKISFFSLTPGYIDTRMTAADDRARIATGLPGGRYASPQEVAQLVHNIVENYRVFVSGQCFNYDKGAHLL